MITYLHGEHSHNQSYSQPHPATTITMFTHSTKMIYVVYTVWMFKNDFLANCKRILFLPTCLQIIPLTVFKADEGLYDLIFRIMDNKLIGAEINQ